MQLFAEQSSGYQAFSMSSADMKGARDVIFGPEVSKTYTCKVTFSPCREFHADASSMWSHSGSYELDEETP